MLDIFLLLLTISCFSNEPTSNILGKPSVRRFYIKISRGIYQKDKVNGSSHPVITLHISISVVAFFMWTIYVHLCVAIVHVGVWIVCFFLHQWQLHHRKLFREEEYPSTSVFAYSRRITTSPHVCALLFSFSIIKLCKCVNEHLEL